MAASETIEQEMRVDADAATVFTFFTDPERLIRWMGTSAQLEARPGGLMLVDVQKGFIARGEFKEVLPVTRLAFSWGWEGSQNVPPSSSLVEIDLLPEDGKTLVRFKHSGLPAEQVAGHREGWRHYLGRLAVAASGGDPGPDTRRAQSS